MPLCKAKNENETLTLRNGSRASYETLRYEPREAPRDTIATIDEKPIYNQRKTNTQSTQNQQAIKVKPTPLKKR